MSFTTIIDVETLAGHYTDPDWVIIDCRFDLLDKSVGRQHYQIGHIPGAVYAHLEEDLSVPMGPVGEGGRHPLPSPEQMMAVFGRFGIGQNSQVVAYDDTSGHYAARLWWMLRFMGHDSVALLDGGWPAWQEAGLPVRSGLPRCFTAAKKSPAHPATWNSSSDCARMAADSRSTRVNTSPFCAQIFPPESSSNAASNAKCGMKIPPRCSTWWLARTIPRNPP